MAAGIGSRFGTGIKQLEPVDASNHIIMDYSIHDAIEAGFNRVVFIIRKDIEKEFKEVIGDRITTICSAHDVTVDYAFQDIKDIPGTLPEGRTKPWGTRVMFCAFGGLRSSCLQRPVFLPVTRCTVQETPHWSISESMFRHSPWRRELAMKSTESVPFLAVLSASAWQLPLFSAQKSLRTGMPLKCILLLSTPRDASFSTALCEATW